MLAVAQSCTLVGIEAVPVQVEVDVSPGLPAFEIVGLPGTAVRESRDRVRAAIRNSDFEFPLRRVTVNLAPANLRKEGALFDLPIALGVLAASGQLPAAQMEGWVYAGELSLDGSTRAIRGALSIALMCRERRRALMVSAGNDSEVSLVGELRAAPVSHLREAVVATSLGGTDVAPVPRQKAPPPGPVPSSPGDDDLCDVRGQQRAKRALEIAAAGGHSILLVGPPGSGKTMLARRLPGLLPPLEWDEALMVTRVHSVAGLLADGAGLVRTRPFRSPHHTTTLAGLIGGGATPKPGEVTLAHRGVLFLDEFPEWPQAIREALRQPIEDGKVTLSRAGTSVAFPAEPLLVLASNPCSCGFQGDDEIACRCGERELAGYRQRLSGPILDRVDLRVAVGRLSPEDLVVRASGETSAVVRGRVVCARERQRHRNARVDGQRTILNAYLSVRETASILQATPDGAALLDEAVRRLRLTARSYHRILKVSRTIADLGGEAQIQRAHIAEALQYRWSPQDTR